MFKFQSCLKPRFSIGSGEWEGKNAGTGEKVGYRIANTSGVW